MPQVETSQPNLSNHLACLRGCGLVRTQREGRQILCKLASERLAHALEDMMVVDFEIGEHKHMDGVP